MQNLISEQHRLRGFIPLLKEAGVSETDLQPMLVENPAKFLAF
jgi:predicted metal-dependent phosphotriesterase family hydrolase